MIDKVLTGTVAGILLLAPFSYAQDQRPSPAKTTQAKGSGMSEDMREAIAWEHAKDRAAARQARIEARRSHPEQSANRTMDNEDTGRKVKDTNAPGAKRDQ